MDLHLVNLLACPDCRGGIKLFTKTKGKKKTQSLQCIKCKRVFKIREGIPVMLPK